MAIPSDIAEKIAGIGNNRTDGASQLARQAVQVVRAAAGASNADDTAAFFIEIEAVGEALKAARPSMAPVSNIVSRLMERIAGNVEIRDVASAKLLVDAEAVKLVEASLAATGRIAALFVEKIPDGAVLITNSYSSTVIAALVQAGKERDVISVIAIRSGPGRSGERTVRELAAAGIPVTLIDDSAVSSFIGGADIAVVGADRICAEGSLVNGVGTCQLAILSQKAGVPFYVVCDTLKFDGSLLPDEADLEDYAPEELCDRDALPPGVIVRNPHFDVTPRELVASVVTEEGLR